MKVVRDATWTDMRGVVHIAEWGISERGGHHSYFLICSGAMVAKTDDENATPTCVHCVVGK